MQFTKAAIAALEVSTGKDDIIEWDDTMPGFGVRCRRGGSKVWVIQYRIGAQQRRESLGATSKVDLAGARKIAKQRFAQVQLGQDPGAKAAPQLTLRQAIDLYQAQAAVRPSTFKKREHALRTSWAPLHGRPLASISRADMSAVVEKIAAERGRSPAGRARITLNALCTWAVQRGLIEHNLVSGSVNPAPSSSRDRVLEDSELAVVWRVCGDDTFGRIIKLLILLGARANEVAGLHWSELDLESGLLIIPPERIKTGKTLRLALPPQAVEILKAIPRKDGCEFVFPSDRGTAFTAWSYCKATLDARITKALGRPLAPWRVHDLRRSTRSGLSRIGIRPDVAEAVLNHTKRGVLGTYDRYDFSREVQAALLAWAAHIEQLLTDSKPDRVVALRR
jgi:integrase